MSDLSDACLDYHRAVQQYSKAEKESRTAHYLSYEREHLERAENRLLDVITSRIEERFKAKEDKKEHRLGCAVWKQALSKDTPNTQVACTCHVE